MNILSLLLSSTSQGVLWALLAIGVYLTYRILDIADLTAEGSFPLGAGIAAISITNGISPLLASLLGFVGGMGAGLITGLLHTKLKIPALLAGIITMTGLYSITSRIMKAPNIPFAWSRNDFHMGPRFRNDKKQCCNGRWFDFCTYCDRLAFCILPYRNWSCDARDW
jgi:putative ABC transport system permease protein